MSERVILHVGTPKSGTSYLQDVLFRNRAVLKTANISYLADRFDSHFLAALDLMRLPWGGLQSAAIGAWDTLAEQVRVAEGTAIVSHEILAAASRVQIGRALESLGHGNGTEVHLVLSVRDLARQIPAEWQENVKHRATLGFADFLDQLSDPARATRIGSWFWSVQEIPDILDRWGIELPPEQIHLVTVPAPGGPPDQLWQRFSRAFGLDRLAGLGIELDLEAERANPSLGVPETALLRRINLRVNAELPPAHYRPLVRELLAHQTLSRRTDSPRLALPPAQRPWVEELSASWVEEVRRRGYHVIGDLDDLLIGPERVRWPRATTAPYADPDRPRERQVARAGVDAIKALLLDNARLRHETERLHAELGSARAELERAYDTAGHRLRRSLYLSLERNLVGRAALAVYRRTRGRSSRSA